MKMKKYVHSPRMIILRHLNNAETMSTYILKYVYKYIIFVYFVKLFFCFFDVMHILYVANLKRGNANVLKNKTFLYRFYADRNINYV